MSAAAAARPEEQRSEYKTREPQSLVLHKLPAPYDLRLLLASWSEVLGAVLRIVMRVLLGWHRTYALAQGRSCR